MNSELRSYIDMVNDECNLEQLHEMANIHTRTHGIQDIVVWVGRAPKTHGLRVKVSNVKNRYDDNNNFVIRMPSLDYDPTQVANWITTKIMTDIINWIKLNQDLLHDYELGIIDDTVDFLNNISKI